MTAVKIEDRPFIRGFYSPNREDYLEEMFSELSFNGKIARNSGRKKVVFMHME